MTAAAVGLAFLPVAFLGDQPGFEVLQPMGLVILGGLVTATLVNLFVTPAIYLGFGNRRSTAELDLRLFEDELARLDRPVPVTASEARD
jgi:Cu/Ag efflux pump CusA